MKAILHQIAYKAFTIALAIAMLFTSMSGIIKADSKNWKTNYNFVFVHGLMGWGSYDPIYKLMPYWGMFGGDLMEYLTDKGFNVCCASVAPTGSAWDRACELYAQLTGTVVDYGKEHSERCKHARYGKDYTGKALVKSFSEKDKINLLGHSFGGTTIRMFASVMANGSEAEKKATDPKELSPYFQGGKGSWIYSLTSLAAPHNGTTGYSVPDESPEREDKPSAIFYFEQFMLNSVTGTPLDGRIKSDYADSNMYIDNALEMNKSLTVYKDTYYFSFACSSTEKQEDGTYKCIESKTEKLFIESGNEIGRYTGVTEAGYVIDEKWLENDGLVNTYSALAPFNNPSQNYNPESVPKGTWNIMPVYSGDHMSLEGGLFIVNDIKGLYLDHLSMINSL